MSQRYSSMRFLSWESYGLHNEDESNIIQIPLLISTSSGKYARWSFRSASPGGSAQWAVLTADGADIDH